MNVPPTEFIRVAPDALHDFVKTASTTVGLSEDKADLLARLLVDNDKRGVFSHGTTQIATYARLMRDGILNNQPNVQVVKETPVSVLYDGDGGLGYFPAYANALRVVEKARDQGIAVGLTRNHGHFGAAGIYSRLALGKDLLAYVTSGHQLNLEPGQTVFAAAGGSPMSFCVPANEEESIVLDFGAIHDMYPGSPFRDAIAKLGPGTAFRSIGLGAICQTWGGFLAGVPFDTKRANRTWEGANQGSLVIAFRIDLFIDPAQFKAEVDEYIRMVHQMEPVVGFNSSHLPGEPEAIRTREYSKEGVPVGKQHQERLKGLAQELGIPTPW